MRVNHGSDVNKDLGPKAKAKALGYQGQGQGQGLWSQGQGQGLEMSKPITTRSSADADNRLDAFSGQSR